MWRTLRTLLCATSLLLSVATVALWIRSASIEDRVGLSRPLETTKSDNTPWTSWRYAIVTSSRGGVCAEFGVEEFNYHTWELGPPNQVDSWHQTWDASEYPIIDDRASKNYPVLFSRIGFQLAYDHSETLPRSRARRMRMTLPHAFIALVLALPAVAWTRRHLRSRKTKSAGACLLCGYDLRATPDRCPECGAVPTDAPAS